VRSKNKNFKIWSFRLIPECPRSITLLDNIHKYSLDTGIFRPPVNVQILGFEVLTAASMKVAVFWVVAPCSLVLAASETMVNFYQTTRRYNPEGSHLRPDFKSVREYDQTVVVLNEFLSSASLIVRRYAEDSSY
jgi:hypothetical protein